MRLILSILLIAALAYLAGTILPWWSIAIVAFGVTALLSPSPRWGFIAGFGGIFLLWTLLAAWIDVRNKSILSQKIASLFPLGGSSVLLILVTALVGGLVGGFAGMAGGSLRPKRSRRKNG
jgi:hypothetical protein